MADPFQVLDSVLAKSGLGLTLFGCQYVHVRRSVTVAAVVLCVSASLVAKPSDKEANPIAFTHVTVIDATGAPPMSDMAVVVSEGKITAIGQTASVPVPPGATVVDGTGKVLIPGFWDMHTHLSDSGVAALALLVENGVTGVRDVGSDIWQIDNWREEIRNGIRRGPEILRAGPVVDGPNPQGHWRVTVTTPEEGRCAVETLRTGLHVDLIKVHAAVPRDAFFALAKEARGRSVPLACHLPVSVTIQEASDAGCTSIEHVAESFGESLLRSRKLKTVEEVMDALLSEPGLEIFQVLARNKTWVDPTLVGYGAFVRMAEPCPTPQKSEYCVQSSEFNQKDLDARRAVLQQLVKAVGIMHKSGVKLLAGTDFSEKEQGLTPGVSLHQELQLLVQAGLTPLEAIQVGTRDAAEYLGLLAERGTVEQGKIADLVLLNKDPLENIANTTAIEMVLVRGHIVMKRSPGRTQTP
jgi:imidazolonepropionase-like amidohydrolase